MKKVIAVGDLHFPFAHKNNLKKLILEIEQTKPEVIVQLGDLYDRYSHSRFSRMHSIMTPTREVQLARSHAEEFWGAVKDSAPQAKCFQIKGNHDARAYKMLLEKSPELECFFSDIDYFMFDGVETIHDPRAELEIDGVIYIHGHRSKLGDHMRYYLKPVVCGHSHQGGVVFQKLYNRIIFECNAGFLADCKAVPLKYTPTTTNRWTQGYGLLDERGPRFIPL